MNCFSLFKLPASYQIDMKKLKSNFLDLQRKYHPDKFIGSTKTEQLASVKKSADINKAWNILRNPITRAEHLLSIHNFDVVNENRTVLNTKFIKKQFKLREQFSEIKKLKDKKKLQFFIKNIKKTSFFQYAKMAKYLNDREWSSAADILFNIRFLDKLLKDAEKIEEGLLNFKFGIDHDSAIQN